MLQLFRVVALIEGITTIALFFVAMPLKYWFDQPALIRPVGMTHGVAWLVYLAAMLVCVPGKGFSLGEWLRTFAASLVPLGTFLNDRLIARKVAARAVTRRAGV